MAAKKIVKRVVLVVVIVIVVIIVALGIFISTFDVNKYKPMVEEKVSAAVGYNLKIDGEMGLSIFPSIAIEVKGLHLANPEQFQAQAQDLVFVEKANVGLALIPLLSKRLEFKDITLQGVNLNLIKPKTGAPNWDFNAHKQQAKTESANQPAATTAATGGDSAARIAALLNSLSFNQIEVKNTNVTYFDLASGSTQKFENINFTCGPFDNADKPLQFELSASLNKTPLSVKGQLTSLKQILEGAAPFNVAATFGKLKANVEGTFAAASDPMLEATMTVPAFSPKEALKAVMPTLPDIIAKAGGNAFTKLETTQKITVSAKKVISFAGPFTFDQTGGNVSGSLSSKDGVQNVTLKLDANQINLNNYLATSAGKSSGSAASAGGSSQTAGGIPAPNEIFGKGALAKMNLNADIKLNQAIFQDITINGLNASAKLNRGSADASFSGNINKGDLKGDASGSYNNKNNIHNISVTANIPELNLDSFMGGDTKTASAGSGSSTKTAAAKKPILDPVIFNKLNVAANVKLDRLILKGLTFSAASLNAKLNQGNTDAVFSAKYGNAALNGTFKGNLTAQSSSKALTFKSNGLPIEPFMKAFTNKDLLTGALTADVNVSGTGMDIDDFKRSLTGRASANIGSGTIKVGPGLAFNSIVMEMAFNNGKGDISKGEFKSQLLSAGLSGWINLSNDTLDVTLTPTQAMPVETLASLVGLALPAGVSSGLSAKIPFRVHGSFSSPSFDWSQSLGSILQNLDIDSLKQIDLDNVQQNLQKGVQEKLDEALPGAGGLLEGLLGGGKKKDQSSTSTSTTPTTQSEQTAPSNAVESPAAAEEPAAVETPAAETPAAVEAPAAKETPVPVAEEAPATTETAAPEAEKAPAEPAPSSKEQQKEDLKDEVKDAADQLLNNLLK